MEDLVLIGGPNDGVITPWQSRCVSVTLCVCANMIYYIACSHFGFYDEKLVVQPYQSQEVRNYSLSLSLSLSSNTPSSPSQFYMDDTFGLKTLDQGGRVHVYEVGGVKHTDWHRNRTVFDQCMEPWLK